MSPTVSFEIRDASKYIIIMSQQFASVLDLLLASAFCSFKDSVLLDIAVSSCLTLRTEWLRQVQFCIPVVADRLHQSHSTIKWMMKRKIPFTRLLVDCRREDFRDTFEKREQEKKAINYLLERNPLLSIGDFLTLFVSSNPSISYGADDGISQEAKRFQSRLSNMLQIDQVSDLTFIGSNLKTVREVGLFGCQGITDIGLIALADGCPNLKTIDLSDCLGITEAGLVELGQKCRRVQSINVSFCPHVFQIASWIHFGYYLLKTINISYCGKRVTDLFVMTLARRCVLLEVILMDSSPAITDLCLSNLGKGNDVVDLTAPHHTYAYGCKNLQTISLRDCQGITDIGLSALVHGCNRLKTINLSRCKGITDIGLSALGKQSPLLQTIEVDGCQGITNSGLLALVHGCDQLQIINLSHCQGITDNGLSALGNGCGQLQTINLSHCEGITDIGLSALVHGCNRLKTINLSKCQGITDKGLTALTGCAEFEVIRLNN